MPFWDLGVPRNVLFSAIVGHEAPPRLSVSNRIHGKVGQNYRIEEFEVI